MLVALAVFGSRAVRPGRPARVAAAVAQPVAIAAAVDAAVAVPPTMTALVGTPHAYVPLDHPLSCADGSTQSAELHDATGVKALAEVECFYGSSLFVHFVLRPDGRPVDPAAADFPRITAGDTIVVRSGDTVFTGVAPVLDGEVSPDGERVLGRLAPGTATSLAVIRGSLTGVDALWPYADREDYWWERFRSATERFAVTADANGTWSVDLGATATALRPGDSAVIEQRDAFGNRYVMGVAPPTIIVGRALGRSLVAVQATNGTRLAVEVAVPGEPPLRFTRHSDVWGWSLLAFDERGGAILPGFAPRMSTIGAFERVPPGTVVSFTPLAPQSDDPVAAAQRFVAGDVDLAFDAAPVNGPVRGRAGPGRDVDVRVAGPLGLQHVAATAADANGVFTATLPAPLDPGWRALVVEREGPISVAHFLTRRHVRVAVGSPFVMGLGQDYYGSDITVTLRAGNGILLGTGRVDALGGSAWIAQLDGVADAAGNPGPPVVAAPGTRVEVAFDDGDPVVVPVDDISVAVAISGDGLTGTAPPGARVLLSGTDGRDIALGWEDNGAWIDGLTVNVGTTAVAGFDGRWEAGAESLGLGRPLAAGDYGSATVVLASGHALTAGWAPIRVDYDLDSGAAEGVGPPWSRPDVALLDAAGQRVGRRADRVAEPWAWFSGWSAEPNWQAVVGDEQRAGVQPIDGDQLQVTFRSGAVTVPIPPLSGVIHAADGIIVGRSRPGSSVICTLADDRWPVGSAMTATVDAKGVWLLDARASAGTAVSATRGAACFAAVPPHRFHRAIAAPGLTLDLDRGRVEGRVSAGVAVTVSRAHAGRVHTTVGRSDPEGAFSARVPGGAAEPADAPANPLAAGDGVTVAVPDPRGGVIAQEIVVPQLDLQLDVTANRITATTLPSTRLELSMGSTELHVIGQRYIGASRAMSVVVPSDGRLEVDATPVGTLAGGRSVVAALWLASGHRILRRRIVPRFEVPINGHRVCVLGDSAAPVTAALERDGSVVAVGTARISAAGGVAVDLVRADGRPDATRPGDVVTIRYGHAAAVVATSLEIPPLTWTMDWADQIVEGDTVPDSVVAVAFSSRAECQPAPIDFWLAHGVQNTAANTNGHFRWQHGGEMTAGFWALEEAELNLTLPLPGGHAAIARSRELRADAHVDTPWLAGEADAEAVVTAGVTDAAGRPRGAGEVRADAGGRWRMEIGSGAGTPTLRPGDRVTLVSGAQSTLLTVQPFGFDVGRGGDIAGTAPPDATVTAVVDLDPDLGWHQPSRTLSITADASGAWAIPATAGRRGWSLAEAVALTASVAAEGRHRTVAVWRQPVDLGSPVVRLALPWLGRGR